MQSIFETLRNVLHEANIDKRVQYMVEVMFAVRKDGFKQHPAVIEELDKCEEEDQFTHALQLDDDLKGEEGLNVFKPGIAWGLVRRAFMSSSPPQLALQFYYLLKVP